MPVSFMIQRQANTLYLLAQTLKKRQNGLFPPMNKGPKSKKTTGKSRVFGKLKQKIDKRQEMLYDVIKWVNTK